MKALKLMQARGLGFLVRAFLIAGFAVTANAASIGVNVGPTGQEIGAANTAGVVSATNWNDLTGGSLGATALTDNSGTLLATTATVSTQWTNTSGATQGGATVGDQILMNGGLDNGGGVLSSQVTGIPYALYNVYIYFDGGHGGPSARFGEYSATPSGAGASVAQSQIGYDDGTFSGTFIRETGGQDGNYILFENMSGEDLLISSIGQNSPTPRAPWNGYQIVEVEVVPEPTAALLAIFGLFGFLTRRKR